MLMSWVVGLLRSSATAGGDRQMHKVMMGKTDDVLRSPAARDSGRQAGCTRPM